MGKVKLLFEVIGDLRSLADSLQAVAEAMTENDASKEMESAKTPKGKEEPTKSADAKKDTEKKNGKPVQKLKPEKAPLTLEEVRAVLAEKSRAGHTAEVKALLVKHGADKLSEISPEKYEALLKDAEVL